MNELESKDFWKERWQSKETPWDLQKPHSLLPELLELCRSVSQIRKEAKIYVPGCGSGHEAAWFAQQGFQVTAVDYVPEAIEEAERLYGHLPGLTLKVEDVFSTPSEDLHTFDAVVDRAMFCALDPKKRSHYIRACRERLKSEGLFLGILFKELAEISSGGPPFSVTCERFQDISKPNFEMLACEERFGKSGIEFIVSELLIVSKAVARE